MLQTKIKIILLTKITRILIETPHCNSHRNLVSMLKAADKNLTHYGNKRKLREDLEVIKKNVQETTIDIIKEHVSDCTCNPKDKICINHCHSSVIVNSAKSGKNALLLGAVSAMNLSQNHANNEKENHSLLTVCERAQVLSLSSMNLELLKKLIAGMTPCADAMKIEITLIIF